MELVLQIAPSTLEEELLQKIWSQQSEGKALSILLSRKSYWGSTESDKLS